LNPGAFFFEKEKGAELQPDALAAKLRGDFIPSGLILAMLNFNKLIKLRMAKSLVNIGFF